MLKHVVPERDMSRIVFFGESSLQQQCRCWTEERIKLETETLLLRRGLWESRRQLTKPGDGEIK